MEILYSQTTVLSMTVQIKSKWQCEHASMDFTLISKMYNVKMKKMFVSDNFKITKNDA